MQTMIIKAVRTDEGYKLIDEKGNYPQEGLAHKTAQSAYQDAACLWPYNSTWQGHKVHGGYQIVIA